MRMVRFVPDQMCWSEKYCLENEPHHEEHATNELADPTECLQHTEFVVVLLSGKWRDVEIATSPLVGSAEWAKNLRI
jgi:hypothetical protein